MWCLILAMLLEKPSPPPQWVKIIAPLETSTWLGRSWAGRVRAILKLFVQASKCHRNPWKSHFLPQKVTKSTIWNGSSVKWTLVDLDFAFVMISNFEVVPQPRKLLILNYITRGYFWFIPENSRFHYGRHFVYQNKTYVLIFYWFIDSGVHLLLISFLWLWDNLQNP